MSNTALIFKPGKPGRPEGTKITKVAAVEPEPPVLTGPVEKIDHLLKETMLWVYTEQEGDTWYSYAAAYDLHPVGPESLAEARSRAQYSGEGTKSHEARRALGAAVISASLDLQQQLAQPRSTSAAS